MSAHDYLLLPALQGPAAFCTTRWSLVWQAGYGEGGRAAEALEQLCRTYWYPLYVYARRGSYSREEAEDLIQGFIASLVNRDDLARVSPDKGRFRTFLLAALGHYLANHRRDSGRQKRGGKHPVLALDGLSAEERYRLEPATDETPEKLYERKWAREVLSQVRQKLREEYVRTGKNDLFALLEPLLIGRRDTQMRREIAIKFGISSGAVDVALHRLRRRFGELVRELISQTVQRPEDVDAEIQHLMATLS